MRTQVERLKPEPIKNCNAVNCKFPVCHCYDADTVSKEAADAVIRDHVEEMLSRLRSFIDDLKFILSRPHYHSHEQLRVYRKRKIRLQKNFNYWKKRYDLIRSIPIKK